MIWLAFPRLVLACATCYGAPDSPLTHGMNLAIVTLLGVTGCVLGGVATFLASLWRRAHVLSQPGDRDPRGVNGGAPEAGRARPSPGKT